MAHLIAWLATKTGKKFVSYVAVSTSIGVFAATLAPHTVLLYYYKDIIKMYSEGEEVPLDENVAQRAQEVCKNSALNSREKRLISFFTVFGLDVRHAGSTSLRLGAIIGLPYNFRYRSVSDVRTSSLTVPAEDFSFSSSAGQELLDSLVLSSNAQKFAIAREIQQASTNYPFFHSGLASFCCFSTYGAGVFFNERLRLFQRSLSMRLTLYGILGSIGIAVYITTRDALILHYEARADRRAADMGKDYILGGIELYQKALQRNKALRQALGKKGEKNYTVHGNYSAFIRTKHIPLSVHLDYMKERLEELGASSENASNQKEPI